MWASTWTKGLTDALEKTGEAISEAEKRAAKGLTDALEKTGEAITQAATQAKKPEKPPPTPPEEETKEGEEKPDDITRTGENAGVLPPGKKVEVLKNLQKGWSSVVETTKRTVEATKEVVENERTRLERNFLHNEKSFYVRDPKKDLDREALRDADVVYITDRILSMSHPAMKSKVNPNITPQRKLAAVGHLLNRRHDGRYLVWNLSEMDYENSVLNDQVLTFSFPGSPSPPLGLLLKLLVSMENWMKADKRNVAVVHCLTGKGRTSMVLAAFLCWMGEAGFKDMNQAIEYIAKCKKTTVQQLTIPSQRRYASYFKNMLDGVRPSQPPLLLKRIVMSEAPRFAKGPDRVVTSLKTSESDGSSDENQMGCAPYLQIFKAGKLLFTTAATMHVQQAEEELPFVYTSDGTVCFNIDEVIQGDILIRCRHLTFKKQRVSMFRAAFHTGYVPPNVLRLTKTHLDGACTDNRFSDDFFLDLIFEKADTKAVAQHLSDDVAREEDDDSAGAAIVRAAPTDSMLVGESRFWEVISKRREEQSGQKTSVDFFGETVGRRRDDPEKEKKNEESKQSKPDAKARLGAFSIGNDFDFLPASEEPQQEAKKDALMEELDALDEDEQDVEEITFDSDKEELVAMSAFAKESSSTLEADGNTGQGTQVSVSDDGGEETNSDEALNMDDLLASTGDEIGEMNLDDFEMDEDDLGDLDDLEAMLNT